MIHCFSVQFAMSHMWNPLPKIGSCVTSTRSGPMKHVQNMKLVQTSRSVTSVDDFFSFLFFFFLLFYLPVFLNIFLQDPPPPPPSLVHDLTALLDPRYINWQLRVQHPPATDVGNKDTVLREGRHVATAKRPITSQQCVARNRDGK